VAIISPCTYIILIILSIYLSPSQMTKHTTKHFSTNVCKSNQAHTIKQLITICYSIHIFSLSYSERIKLPTTYAPAMKNTSHNKNCHIENEKFPKVYSTHINSITLFITYTNFSIFIHSLHFTFRTHYAKLKKILESEVSYMEEGLIVLLWILSIIISLCILSAIITNSVKKGIIQAYYNINYKNQQLYQQQTYQQYSNNSQS